MTAPTLTLAEFLLARFAEDEDEARRGVGWADRSTRWGRVLAECEAKRRIVEVHAVGQPVGLAPDRDGWQVDLTPRCAEDHARYPCDTLRLLAAPYANHPDYRTDWA